MLDYIRGPLASIDVLQEEIVIDHQGLGFRVSVSGRLISTLPPKGEEVYIFVDMVANEREISLYGFENQAARSFFRLICRHVKNVGPSIAMRILASGTVADMKQAILQENNGFFSAIKGIGKKTAERIVHELKDVVAGLPTGSAVREPESGEVLVRSDAIKTLVALGLPENSAVERINSVLKETEEDLEVEDIVKKALKF